MRSQLEGERYLGIGLKREGVSNTREWFLSFLLDPLFKNSVFI